MPELVQIKNCPRCDSPIALPEALYETAKRCSKTRFHCAFGHELHFPEDECVKIAIKEAEPIKQVGNVIPFRRRQGK